MRPFRLLRASALPALLLALAQPSLAHAKGSELDTGSRVLPYSGVLEFNGSAYTGTVDLQMTVTDNSSCTFVELFENVNVYAGRFTLGIGSQTSGGVPACVFNASGTYVKIAVRNGTSTGAYTSLSGSQPLRAVPYSLWAAQAGTNLTVDGTLTTGGNATIAGNLDVKGTVSSLAVEGPELHLGLNDGRTASSTSQVALAHLSGDQLAINPNGEFTGGVVLTGAVTVEKNLVVESTQSAASTVGGTLTASNTPGLTGSGSATTGARSDHSHTFTCPGGTVGVVENTSTKSRLCVYKIASSMNYNAAAAACWSTYGAQLCTMNQAHLLCSQANVGIAANYWLRDRTYDNKAIRTYPVSCDNLDWEQDVTTTEDGAYCCISDHHSY